MFTTVERKRLRDELIQAACVDDEVVGAALVGSAATGREDAWSDIDLVLQIGSSANPKDVADRWKDALYDHYGAAHHLDIIAEGVLYRVFFLASSLQVDVSFWPEGQFRASEPSFKVVFGDHPERTEPREPDASREIGWAWLYALHSRSAVARGRTWQAIMMLDQLRDQLLVLACLRHGLNPHHGREADRLPSLILERLEQTRARTSSTPELARSHSGLVQMLVDEVPFHDPDLAKELSTPLHSLARIDLDFGDQPLDSDSVR